MEIIKGISSFAVPAIFLMILGFGAWRDIKVYDEFVEGAKEGLATVVRILPSLVGLLVAVGVFRASGALDLLVYAAGPLARLIGLPSEAMPLALMRPISGSASIALVNDIIQQHGPDSFIGRLVSTMMGSTETIFYTLAVYFGSAGIRNIRYTLVAALIADVVGVVASVWICTVLFGGR